MHGQTYIKFTISGSLHFNVLQTMLFHLVYIYIYIYIFVLMSALNDKYIFHRCENVSEMTGYITKSYKGLDYVFEIIHSLRATNRIRLIASAVTIVYIYAVKEILKTTSPRVAEGMSLQIRNRNPLKVATYLQTL